MDTRLARVVALSACALLLIAGTDAVTYAATGDSLIAGHLTNAKQRTTLVNTGEGPALRLISEDSTAPSLAVSSTAKVMRLNADRVDGRSAKDLEPRTRLYSLVGQPDGPVSRVAYHIDAAPGLYEAAYSLRADDDGSVSAQCVLEGSESFYYINGIRIDRLGPNPVASISGSGIVESFPEPSDPGLDLICYSTDQQPIEISDATVFLRPVTLGKLSSAYPTTWTPIQGNRVD